MVATNSFRLGALGSGWPAGRDTNEMPSLLTNLGNSVTRSAASTTTANASTRAAALRELI